MSKFEKLIALRKKYPATTSAAHSFVIRAADLKRSHEFHGWVRIDGRNKARVAFDAGMRETLFYAALETNATEPEKLLKFVTGFFAQFALACPGWNDVLPEIVDGFYKDNKGPNSLFEQTIAQIQEAQDQANEASAG